MVQKLGHKNIKHHSQSLISDSRGTNFAAFFIPVGIVPHRIRIWQLQTITILNHRCVVSSLGHTVYRKILNFVLKRKLFFFYLYHQQVPIVDQLASCFNQSFPGVRNSYCRKLICFFDIMSIMNTMNRT